MLNGIDPRTSAELLSVLAHMGHGDEIVVADANYPAARTVHSCTHDIVISYPGHNAALVCDLITKLMPLDGFHDHAALRMEVDKAPNEMTDAHTEVWQLLEQRLPENAVLASIERHAFYQRAAKAFAVVHCGETRPYGCFILRKGVVF